jgi:hypothetical protein
MNVSLCMLEPGINNSAVPMAINTVNPSTSCKATGTWRELADPALLPMRIIRCRRRSTLAAGFFV